MIDLHEALAEIRRRMGETPPGSAVRFKLMAAATSLADAIALVEKTKPAEPENQA